MYKIGNQNQAKEIGVNIIIILPGSESLPLKSCPKTFLKEGQKFNTTNIVVMLTTVYSRICHRRT